MISRIKIDAYGTTAAEVENVLFSHADHIEELLGVSVSRGDCVIERNLEEPPESRFFWKGRLSLHPDISAGTGEGNPPTYLVEEPAAA